MTTNVIGIIKLMRVPHYVKNGLIFFPLFFSLTLFFPWFFIVCFDLPENVLTLQMGFITTRIIIRAILSMAIIMATFVISKLFIFNSKKIGDSEK